MITLLSKIDQLLSRAGEEIKKQAEEIARLVSKLDEIYNLLSTLKERRVCGCPSCSVDSSWILERLFRKLPDNQPGGAGESPAEFPASRGVKEHSESPGAESQKAVNLPRGVGVWLLDRTGQGVWLSRRSKDLSSYPRALQTPGGSVEPGEDDLAAALRELREETGLIYSPENLVHLHTGEFTKPNGESYVAVQFLVACSSQLLNTEPEKHSDWEIYPLDEVPYEDLMDAARVSIRLIDFNSVASAFLCHYNGKIEFPTSLSPSGKVPTAPKIS